MTVERKEKTKEMKEEKRGIYASESES